MIISSFNKYVEKHGRVTYIVLGIIICFMFVIFVGNGSEFIGGCTRGRRPSTVGKMYGKKIKFNDFMLLKRQTDIACYFRYGMFLSEYNDAYLNSETFDRMRMIHEAKKAGFYKQVTDKDVAKAIHDIPVFKDEKGNFSLDKFNNFKSGFLRSYMMKATDFDDMIRQNLAIAKMTESITKDVAVGEMEIDAQLAEYKLKHAEIAVDMDKASEISDKEVADFFANRKADIKMEAQRKAIVATVSTESVLSKPEVAVTEEEALKHFTDNKDGLYSGSTFEVKKAQIMASLSGTKARMLARKQAEGIAAALAGKEVDAAAFEKAAADAGAALVKCDYFTVGSKLPGLEGDHVMLANSIRTLDKKGTLTKVVIDGSAYSLAMLEDIKDGVLPSELNDEVKGKVLDAIMNERAVAFYNEKIASYRDAAPGTRAGWELGRKEMEAIQADESRSDEEKQAALMNVSDYVREIVQPFYVQEERSFSAVAYSYDSYKESVTITDSDIKKGYEARKAKYENVDVRLSKVVVDIADDADADAKAAAKAKAEEAYKKAVEGKDIAELAAEYSGDENNDGDTGAVAINTLDKELQAQVRKLQVGQLSTVIETADGYVFFKLVEKAEPKTFDAVKGEIASELTLEAAKKAAIADAERAYVEIAKAWDEAGHKDAEKVAILKNNTTEGKAEFTEVPMTRQYSYGAFGAAGDNALMAAVFAVKAAEPFTKAVAGTEAAYIAVLGDVAPAHLMDAKDDISLTVNVYKRSVAMDAALAKANAEISRINEALKGGAAIVDAAGETVFLDDKDAISHQNANQFDDVYVRNVAGMLNDLDKAEVNTVIPAQKSYSGYTLVYLESKNVPSGDDMKDTREAVRQQLLMQKKNSVLAKFVQRVQKESDTRDINPGLLGDEF